MKECTPVRDTGNGDPRNQGGRFQGGQNATRLLVEVCCSEESKLGQTRKASEGCARLRVTESHDLRSESTINEVEAEVMRFRKAHPKAATLIFASLPCTGGSPWGHVNKSLRNGEVNIKKHQKLFLELLESFVKLVERLRDERTFIAFELSSKCSYWKWKKVMEVEAWYSLHRLRFHGCQFGLVNHEGSPMLKSWTISTDMDELDGISNFTCDGSHQHAASRGKSLKDAEGYTYKMTDFIHGRFREACENLETPILAMAAAREDEPEVTPSPQAEDEGLTEHEIEERKEAWKAIMRSSFMSLVWTDAGNNQQTKEFTRGMLNDWDAQSCFAAYQDVESPIKGLQDALLGIELDDLATLEPPVRVRQCEAYIVISDSVLAMIDGSKNKYRKHSMEEVFADQVRDDGGLYKFIHRMLWGKNLRALVLEAIKAVRELRNEGFTGQISVAVYWNGNELVGPRGIENEADPPYRQALGRAVDHMDEAQRHVMTLLEFCKGQRVSALAILGTTEGGRYGLGNNFSDFMKEFKGWVESLKQPFTVEQDTSICFVDMEKYCDRVDLLDRYHMEKSDRNQHETLVVICCVMYMVSLSNRPAYTAEWKTKLRRLIRFGRRNPQEFFPNKDRQEIGEVEYYVKYVQPIMRRRKPIAQQSPDPPFTIYELRAEQPDRNAPYDDDMIVEEGGSSEPAEMQETAEPEGADAYFAPDYDAEEIEQAATDEIAEDEPAAGEREPEVQPWEDYTRIPGVYEAAVTEEVVNPELRGKVSRRDNWAPMSIRNHVDEYRYLVHVDTPDEEVGTLSVRIGQSVFKLLEFTGWDNVPPTNRSSVPQKYHQGRLNRMTGLLRGHGNKGKLPRAMEDGWIDIDEFARAVLRDMPDLRTMSMFDIIAIAGSDSKNRFEFRGVSGDNQCRRHGMSFWPFQVRASQGHAQQILDEAGKYRSAEVVFASEEQANACRAVLRDKPVETNPAQWPETTFHRTTRGAWKSILQYGVLVGGGSRSKLAKAHIYMSEYRTADDRYQTGQRRQNPIEIEIDLKRAISDGFICFRTTAKSVLSAMPLKPEYLLSITDTDEGRILWHKNLAEPQQAARGSTEEYTQSAPRYEATVSPVETAHRQVEPVRKLEVWLCTECNSEVPVGAPVCETCGKDYDVVVRHEDPTVEANMRTEMEGSRRQNILMKLEKRMELLNKLGISYLSGSVMRELEQAYGHAFAGMRQGRGVQSREADLVSEAKKKRKRSDQLGHASIADRFNEDADFRRHMTAAGKTDERLMFLDLLSFFHLPAPPRSRAQIVLNTGENLRLDHEGWRLAFINSKKFDELPLLASQKGIEEPWAVMNLGSVYSLAEFGRMVNYARSGRGFNVITHQGTYHIQGPDAYRKLKDMARECYPAAQRDVRQKSEQSAKAKAKATYTQPFTPEERQERIRNREVVYWEGKPYVWNYGTRRWDLWR